MCPLCVPYTFGDFRTASRWTLFLGLLTRHGLLVAAAFRQDFGRVQALIIVFSRIVDVENFSEVVLSGVRDEEKRELEHRLGILNVQNPVRVRKRPGGSLLLDT